MIKVTIDPNESASYYILLQDIDFNLSVEGHGKDMHYKIHGHSADNNELIDLVLSVDDYRIIVKRNKAILTQEDFKDE